MNKYFFCFLLSAFCLTTSAKNKKLVNNKKRAFVSNIFACKDYIITFCSGITCAMILYHALPLSEDISSIVKNLKNKLVDMEIKNKKLESEKVGLESHNASLSEAVLSLEKDKKILCKQSICFSNLKNKIKSDLEEKKKIITEKDNSFKKVQAENKKLLEENKLLNQLHKETSPVSLEDKKPDSGREVSMEASSENEITNSGQLFAAEVSSGSLSSQDGCEVPSVDASSPQESE